MNSNTKKALEAVLVGGVLVVSLNNAAHAVTACTTGVATAVQGSNTAFVKTTFTPKCSANVAVDVIDTGAQFGVKGASAKGNQIYGGSSEGGSVSMCTTFGGSMGTLTATSSAGC